MYADERVSYRALTNPHVAVAPWPRAAGACKVSIAPIANRNAEPESLFPMVFSCAMIGAARTPVHSFPASRWYHRGVRCETLEAGMEVS